MSGANWPVRRSGGISRRSSASGGGSVEGGAGHCPDALGELRCGPLVGLLGSGEDASDRAHLPPSDHPECVADCGAGCLTSGYRCPL